MQHAGKTEVLKFWRLQALPDGEAAPIGQVLTIDATGITLACGAQGQGRVQATQLQKAGGKRLPAAEFLAGFALKVGDVFY